MKTTNFLPVIGLLVMFASSSESFGQWSYNGNDIYNDNAGYVGVGNNTPGTLLYVAKNMGEPTIAIRNLGGGGGATYSMVDDLSGANWKFKATTYGGFKIRDQANSLDVLTIEPNSAANSLYIKTGGNVGIGSYNPSSKLVVRGQIPSPSDFLVHFVDYDDGTDDIRTILALRRNSTGGMTQGFGTAVDIFLDNMICGNLVWFTEDIVGSNTQLQFNLRYNDQFHTRMVIRSDGKVGIGTTDPHPSAKLEINSSGQGFLPPRMTTVEMESITDPAEGLILYNTTLQSPCWYNGSEWICMSGSPVDK